MDELMIFICLIFAVFFAVAAIYVAFGIKVALICLGVLCALVFGVFVLIDDNDVCG